MEIKKVKLNSKFVNYQVRTGVMGIKIGTGKGKVIGDNIVVHKGRKYRIFDALGTLSIFLVPTNTIGEDWK